MGDPTRPVASHRGPDGTHYAQTQTSPTSNTRRAQVAAPPYHVIPIIFVPGIMGSNLMAVKDIKINRGGRNKNLARAGEPVWRIDSAGAFAGNWLWNDAAERQLLINKDNLRVDPSGKVDYTESSEAGSRSAVKDMEAENPNLAKILTQGLDNLAAVRAERRKRGWGTAAWAFYGDILLWLDNSFSGLATQNGKPNAKLASLLQLVGKTPVGATHTPSPLTADMIKKLLNFSFPVHACGYNWAASNLDSGQMLADEIKRVKDGYHGHNGQVCTQVILITHSMGGLVARAAAMNSGAKDSILGVIHGVMPTHGAAAMYKRATLGFGNESTHWLFGWIADEVASAALGYTAKETTPVLAYNPGPLELAPNHRYNGGGPWLIIKDGKGRMLKSLPEKGDPYAEIYGRTDVWWRAVHPEYLNPAKLPIKAREMFIETLKAAKSYHTKLADDGFHPNSYAHYSIDSSHLAWGKLTWKVVASEVYTPSVYEIAVSQGMAGAQRIDHSDGAIKGNPETWRVFEHEGAKGLILRDSDGAQIHATAEAKADAGDETVPALASAAGVDAHSRMVCRHTRGYVHDTDYDQQQVRDLLVDNIVRMIQGVAVK